MSVTGTNLTRGILGAALMALVAGCGGGGSDSGGGESADNIEDYITIRLIRFYIRDESFQPNAAQIACAKTIPSEDPLIESKVQRCVDDNA